MITALDYLAFLTNPTQTRPFDTRIDSSLTNLALTHSLIRVPKKSDNSISFGCSKNIVMFSQGSFHKPRRQGMGEGVLQMSTLLYNPIE